MSVMRPSKAVQAAAESLHLPVSVSIGHELAAPPHPANGPNPVLTDTLSIEIFSQTKGIGKNGSCIMRLNARHAYLVCLHLAKPELAEDMPKIGAQLQYSLNETSMVKPHESLWVDFGPRQLTNFAAVLPFPVPSLRLLVWDGIWTLQARKLGA